MSPFVRVRLSFANVCPGRPKECWFLLDLGICRTIMDFQYLIQTRFELYCEGHSLQLYLDGCVLLPQEKIEILRDNDIIRVENEFSEDFEVNEEFGQSKMIKLMNMMKEANPKATKRIKKRDDAKPKKRKIEDSSVTVIVKDLQIKNQTPSDMTKEKKNRRRSTHSRSKRLKRNMEIDSEALDVIDKEKEKSNSEDSKAKRSLNKCVSSMGQGKTEESMSSHGNQCQVNVSTSLTSTPVNQADIKNNSNLSKHAEIVKGTDSDMTNNQDNVIKPLFISHSVKSDDKKDCLKDQVCDSTSNISDKNKTIDSITDLSKKASQVSIDKAKIGPPSSCNSRNDSSTKTYNSFKDRPVFQMISNLLVSKKMSTPNMTSTPNVTCSSVRTKKAKNSGSHIRFDSDTEEETTPEPSNNETKQSLSYKRPSLWDVDNTSLKLNASNDKQTNYSLVYENSDKLLKQLTGSNNSGGNMSGHHGRKKRRNRNRNKNKSTPAHVDSTQGEEQNKSLEMSPHHNEKDEKKESKKNSATTINLIQQNQDVVPEEEQNKSLEMFPHQNEKDEKKESKKKSATSINLIQQNQDVVPEEGENKCLEMFQYQNKKEEEEESQKQSATYTNSIQQNQDVPEEEENQKQPVTYTNLIQQSQDVVPEKMLSLLHLKKAKTLIATNGKDDSNDPLTLVVNANSIENQNIKANDIKDYSSYPSLQGIPRAGDLIAFKIIELSMSYTPELSDFKEGRVTFHNHETAMIGLELSVKSLNIPLGDGNISNKFELLTEEEEFGYEPLPPKSTQEITIPWKDLLDPRLLS